MSCHTRKYVSEASFKAGPEQATALEKQGLHLRRLLRVTYCSLRTTTAVKWERARDDGGMMFHDSSSQRIVATACAPLTKSLAPVPAGSAVCGKLLARRGSVAGNSFMVLDIESLADAAATIGVISRRPE